MQSSIRQYGKHLKIKKRKSAIFVFERDGTDQLFRRVFGAQGGNGPEYLGFRYDGRKVYIRDSTLSSLLRKVTRAARADADRCSRRYSDKGTDELRALFNYERLIQKFGRVEDFDEKQEDYKKWTFWTYSHRAALIFGPLGYPIRRQLRNYRRNIRAKADNELSKAVARREKRVQQKALSSTTSSLAADDVVALTE